MKKDFCFVWANSIFLTTNKFPLSSRSAAMKWANLGVSGRCPPLVSQRHVRTARWFIGHISAGNTIATANNNKCVVWRDGKRPLINLNDGSFNMSTMFARCCAAVVLAMISEGKHGFIDLQLDRSPRQPGAFGCKPQ